MSVCDKFIDLTTSSPDVPTDHLPPRQLKPNPSSKVKRQTTGRIRFQTIKELTRLILDDPGNDILDPPECKCPSCPYCRGCMATQRYVLLERCLQIDNLFKLRPDLYGVAGLEDYEWIKKNKWILMYYITHYYSILKSRTHELMYLYIVYLLLVLFGLQNFVFCYLLYRKRFHIIPTT